MLVVRRIALTLLLAATALPATAAAKPPDDAALWATINVCDTRSHPDTIGIRGSMPGLGKRRSRMFIRFRVQYLAQPDNVWQDVASGADSGWKALGRTTTEVRETGQDFRFAPPSGGGAHRLRGVVTYKWLAPRRKKVLLRARRLTSSGHASERGADPPGYSAAICDIT